jgi:hypothetical protein
MGTLATEFYKIEDAIKNGTLKIRITDAEKNQTIKKEEKTLKTKKR